MANPQHSRAPRALRAGIDEPATGRTGWRRWRFIAGVLIVGLVVIVAFLVWDSLFRPYAITARYFPDEGIRAAMPAFDADGDGTISHAEADQVTALSVSGSSEIAGLQIFPNLNTLIVTSDKPVSVDVSGAKRLTELDVSACPQLSSVTLEGNTALRALRAQGSSLPALDVSEAPHLASLDVARTPLAALDVSPAPGLTTLSVSESGLETLTVTGLASLERLDAAGCPLTSLDLAGCDRLQSLTCADNVAITGLDSTGLKERWTAVSYTAITGDAPEESLGARAETTLDEQGRLAQVAYTDPNGSGLDGACAAYFYNGAGNLAHIVCTGAAAAAVNAAGTWNLTYDAAGHLVHAASGATQCLDAAYDDEGRIVELTVKAPDTETLARAASVWERAVGASSLGSLAALGGFWQPATAGAGGLTAGTLTFSYDDAGRVSAVEHSAGETWALAYDDSGRLARATCDVPAGERGQRFVRNGEADASARTGSQTDEPPADEGAQSRDAAESDTQADASGAPASDADSEVHGTLSYSFEYDETGRCTACTLAADGAGAVREQYVYAAGGALANAVRTVERTGNARASSADAAGAKTLASVADVAKTAVDLDARGNVESVRYLNASASTIGGFSVGYRRVFVMPNTQIASGFTVHAPLIDDSLARTAAPEPPLALPSPLAIAFGWND